MSTLSHEKARRTYDRIGSLQDTQAFYEDRATGLVRRHGDFENAESVFEFGCGTGRFAAHLFAEHLSGTARYRGVDVSPRMVELATARLAPYSTRVDVILSAGNPPNDEATASCDRFVSNYVFDLLSHDDIRSVICQAHRILRPGGLLCLSGLSGLSSGSGFAPRIVARVTGWIHTLGPALIGGCRPVDLLPFLAESRWQVQHHTKLTAFGIGSEAVVAKRR